MKTYHQILDTITDPKKCHDERIKTIEEIESINKRPLICYVAKLDAPLGSENYINQNDIVGFADLISSVSGDQVDLFLESPGGEAEAAEYIVSILRHKFKEINIIIPRFAYSAATMLALSANFISMDYRSALGPIDPQVNGVPARSIINSIDKVKKILIEEGPQSLGVYLPMISKYPLHVLDIIEKAEELSIELVTRWLQEYNMKDKNQEEISKVVEFFRSYDVNKSHRRRIDINKCKELGLNIINHTENEKLAELYWYLISLYHHNSDKGGVLKIFENSKGISWYTKMQEQKIAIPLVPQSPQNPQTPKP